MSAGNFSKCLPLTLGYEGGWSDNPRDPGGATMCGVTQAVYDVYRARFGLPTRSVRLSTAEERSDIYHSRYWNRARGDLLPVGVDYAVFDFAVNSGVSRAVRTLQGIVGADQDGDAGKYTIAAVTRYCAQYQPTALTDALCHARLQFLRNLPAFGDFGHGWMIRVMGHHDGTQWDDTGVIDRAFDMARGAAPTKPAIQIVTPKTYSSMGSATA
jgi:lysozyme family protein